MAEEKRKQINIDLSEEIAEGTYSNLAIISHSSSEFVMDFIRVLPNMPKAKVKSRIVMTPEHVKRFAKALQDNIEKYEKQFGNVSADHQDGFPPLNFTPTAKA